MLGIAQRRGSPSGSMAFARGHARPVPQSNRVEVRWRMSRQSSWRIIRHLVAPHPVSNPSDSAAPSQGGRRSGPIVPLSRRRIGRRGKALRCWEIVATLEFGSLGTPSAFSVQSGRASRSVSLRGEALGLPAADARRPEGHRVERLVPDIPEFLSHGTELIVIHSSTSTRHVRHAPAGRVRPSRPRRTIRSLDPCAPGKSTLR